MYGIFCEFFVAYNTILILSFATRPSISKSHDTQGKTCEFVITFFPFGRILRKLYEQYNNIYCKW